VPITEEMRERRRGFLGASDVPAILGLSEFSTPGDIWWSKRYKQKPEGKPKPHQEMGNKLEAFAVDMAATELNVLVETDRFVVAENGIMAANLDGSFVLDGKTVPIECKLRRRTDEWRSSSLPGSIINKVPYHECLQTWAQMICTNADEAWLSAILYDNFGITHNMYKFTREGEEERLAKLEHYCLDWWAEYVVAGVMPPEAPTYSVVMSTLRDAKDTKVVPRVNVDEYFEAKDHEKVVVKESKDAKAAMLAHFGDSKVAVTDDGELRVMIQGNGQIKQEANH
jgi:putative phage-type endonuclease